MKPPNLQLRYTPHKNDMFDSCSLPFEIISISESDSAVSH